MTTEKRLIDANELKEKMQEHHDFFVDGVGGFRYLTPKDKARVDEINHCIAEITNAPTVDAVEVVHGRWEDVYCGRREIPRFQCSVCKEFALRKSERDWLGTLHESQALTRYCPYCGAELKEE